MLAGNNAACHLAGCIALVQRQDKDAAPGCCPGMLPPPAPPSSFRGKGTPPHAAAGGRRRLAAYAGDGESYLEKLLRCETAAFTECVSGSGEEKGRRREGSRKTNARKRSSLPRL